MNGPEPCTCAQCVLHRRYYAAVEAQDFDALAEVARDTFNELCNAGAEGDYLRVIADGSWPTAIEHLENWRAAARQRKEGRDA